MPEDAVQEQDEILVEETEESDTEEQDLLRYEIASYPSDMTLQVYNDKWNSNQIVIPPFQRGYVWDQVQASKLIESFLLGIPVPGVFLYKERGTNKLVIIDGQQRILSAVKFFQGLFEERRFRLKKVRSDWEGKTFEELSEPDQLQIKDSILRATVVQQLDPADNSSIYHIFERLNTGGLKLSPMEIRKCVYSGEFFSTLEELNLDHNWREILGRELPDKRLRDVEFILRILALRYHSEEYEKPMKSFLNYFMIEVNRKEGEDLDNAIDEIREVFTRACSSISNTLGEKPFHLRGRINLGLMDSVMTMFSFVDETDLPNIQPKYQELLSDQQYIQDVTQNTSDTAVVKNRFRRARSKLLTQDI